MEKRSTPKSKLNLSIQKHLEIASERLGSSETLLKTKHYKDSISRSYYAILDAANALLLTKKLKPKSHAGSIHLFGLHFVKTGIVPAKYGEWFSKIEKFRSDADYVAIIDFTKSDAQEALRKAKEFVKMSERLLPKLLKEKER